MYLADRKREERGRNKRTAVLTSLEQQWCKRCSSYKIWSIHSN